MTRPPDDPRRSKKPTPNDEPATADDIAAAALDVNPPREPRDDEPDREGQRADDDARRRSGRRP